MHSDTGFNYDGQLVFNGIYSAEHPFGFLTESGELRKSDSELPIYEPGTPETPGKGFKKVDTPNDADELAGNNDLAAQYLSDGQILRYVEENFEGQEVMDVEGNVKTCYVRNTKTADVFLRPQGRVLIRAQKRLAKNIHNYIEDSFDTANLVRWDPSREFLLWLFSKAFQGEVVADNLDVVRLTDISISGRQDRLGEHSEIRGSTDITYSVPALIGVLKGNDIESLTGVFRVREWHLTASLASEGRVHIKTKGDLVNATDVQRTALSIVFMEEMLSVYERWESGPKNAKYPSQEIFAEMYRECREQGIEINFPIEDVIKEYANKRGESDDKGLTDT